MGFTPPASFREIAAVRVPEGDHVGIRLSYSDTAGRRLHFTAGIAGEFAEGGRSVGMYEIASNGQGQLFATGGATWVLVWQGPPPCATHTVAGNGFSRGEFLRTMIRSGVIASID